MNWPTWYIFSSTLLIPIKIHQYFKGCNEPPQHSVWRFVSIVVFARHFHSLWVSKCSRKAVALRPPKVSFYAFPYRETTGMERSTTKTRHCEAAVEIMVITPCGLCLGGSVSQPIQSVRPRRKPCQQHRSKYRQFLCRKVPVHH